MICTGCKRNLTGKKERFDWLMTRGYDEKDAAAMVLTNPSARTPISPCCVVHLETSVDTDEDLVERLRMKAEIKQERKEQMMRQGIPIYERDVFRIFAANENRTIPGQFVLMDADFDDPTYLAPSPSVVIQNDKYYIPMIPQGFTLPVIPKIIKGKTMYEIERREDVPATFLVGNKGTGYPITDIAQLPKRITDKEQWTTFNPFVLWSGNVKIVPVIQSGVTRVPGLIWVEDNTGVSRPLTGLDKRILNSKVLEYKIEQVSFPNPRDPANPLSYPLHTITLEKSVVGDDV